MKPKSADSTSASSIRSASKKKSEDQEDKKGSLTKKKDLTVVANQKVQFQIYATLGKMNLSYENDTNLQPLKFFKTMKDYKTH